MGDPRSVQERLLVCGRICVSGLAKSAKPRSLSSGKQLNAAASSDCDSSTVSEFPSGKRGSMGIVFRKYEFTVRLAVVRCIVAREASSVCDGRGTHR